MKPYEHRKLTEGPDVADIQDEGRRSAVGKFPKPSGDYTGYCSPAKKKTTRRALKRADKAKSKEQWSKE